jgi:hypothetical protein
MGGAQKSMLHPYEDLDLTFRELFTIAKHFSKAGFFREKTDGCNLTWRFDGETFYLARNYENFRSGGQTIEEYRTHLKGHPAEGQFTRALDRLEQLKDAISASGFHEDYDEGVWINMEVIDKKEPQMLKYDYDCFVVHNLCRFVETPKPHVEQVDPTALRLHKFADILCLSGIQVLHAPVVELDKMNPTVYRSFQAGIYEALSEYKLGLDSTLKDWVERSVIQNLQWHGIEFEDAKMLSENVSGRGKFDIRSIRSKYGADTQKEINELCLSSNRIKVRNQVLAMIKHSWLQFGATRLEGVKSSLIDDATKAKERIDDMIDFNIEVVDDKRNENQSIYIGFINQLENFVNLQVEPQIIEGFVYETDRAIYKLTGAFQSLNRICGTARYQFGQLFPEE